MNQICRCCNETKSIDDFVKDKYTKSGYKRLCKTCNAEKMREYHKRDPELSRKKLYAWREKNREYWLDYCKHAHGRKSDFISKGREVRGLSREEAREHAKKRKSEYDKTHKKENQAYRESTKERYNKNKRVYRRNRGLKDPSYKMANTLRSRFGALMNRVKAKRFSSRKALELLGCDMPFFLRWIERNFEQGMTWGNHGKGIDKWNIDHNLCCASFDLTDPEQQKQCFHWSNLFPMWEKHNLNKRANLLVLDYEI